MTATPAIKVVVVEDDPALGEALFPPVRADVLSYYLPW